MDLRFWKTLSTKYPSFTTQQRCLSCRLSGILEMAYGPKSTSSRLLPGPPWLHAASGHGETVGGLSLSAPSPGRSHGEGCSRCLQGRRDNGPARCPYSRRWTEETAGGACPCRRSLGRRNYTPLGTTGKVAKDLVINLRSLGHSAGSRNYTPLGAAGRGRGRAQGRSKMSLDLANVPWRAKLATTVENHGCQALASCAIKWGCNMELTDGCGTMR